MRGRISLSRSTPSRSMLATDITPTRLERAKLALRDFVQRLQGDRIGLVAFAGSAFIQCPLTLDYGAFLESLRSVTVGIIPKGGTALGEAITTGLAAFENQPGQHHALLIITDGEDHDGQIQAASRQAAAKGIKILYRRGRQPGRRTDSAQRGRPAQFSERPPGAGRQVAFGYGDLAADCADNRRCLCLRYRPESGSGRNPYALSEPA